MSPKSSNLPLNTKETILRQVREQIGSDKYEQLTNKFGEDALIDLALESMEQNADRSESKTAGRLGGAITGFIMGMLVGAVFLGASWLLNTALGVPHGYSLAALTNGAVITVPTSIFLAWLRIKEKEKESIDFRTVFSYYTLASLVGGVLGVGRWLLDIEISVMDTFIDPLWGMFNSSFPTVLCVGLAITVVIWVVSLGQSFYNIYDVAGMILILVFILLLVVSLIALLADAPLWKGVLPLLNQNVIGVTLTVTAGLGGLLGLCWPPVLQENA